MATRGIVEVSGEIRNIEDVPAKMEDGQEVSKAHRLISVEQKNREGKLCSLKLKSFNGTQFEIGQKGPWPCELSTWGMLGKRDNKVLHGATLTIIEEEHF